MKQILVVGAGGSGSFLLAHLARFLVGHRCSLPVRVYDGDAISHEGNLLRAPIVAAVDQNRNKAIVLCHRLNLIYGTNLFEPVDHHFDPGIEGLYQESLLVTCVDSMSLRQNVARVIQVISGTPIWCDLGNGLNYGQVLLGWKDGNWPQDQWPGFWEQNEDPEPPCTRTPFELQGALINPTAALAAMMLLEPLLLGQPATHQAAFFGEYGIRLKPVEESSHKHP